MQLLGQKESMVKRKVTRDISYTKLTFLQEDIYIGGNNDGDFIRHDYNFPRKQGDEKKRLIN